MSMDYIRKTYGVPAKRGMVVMYSARDGERIRAKITGASGGRLRARMERYDGGWNRRSSLFHPTWNITYPTNTQVSDAKRSD